MITINGDCSYKEEIIRYFSKEIPTVVPPNREDLLEILSELLIGTKEQRYGSIPKPEHLVVVRDVIRQSIENSKPIPILIPYGGIKGDMSSNVDVAEFANINRLAALDAVVKKYYSIGLIANIRVEDTGAMYLYAGAVSNKTVSEYADKLVKLVRMVTPNSRIIAIPESSMMDLKTYTHESDRWAEAIFNYLHETHNKPELLGKSPSFDLMERGGWKGVIPFEQREHYISRYKALYPGQQESAYWMMLAQYLGGSKVRYEMKGTLAPADRFIQISFVQPIPGTPANMFNNTLYHRTLPLSEARTHMPAWRSKGYLKIDSHGGIKTKITNFGDKELIDQLISSSVTITDGDESVDIKADYLISE